MGEWHPMKTSPKDGTIVLLWFDPKNGNLPWMVEDEQGRIMAWWFEDGQSAGWYHSEACSNAVDELRRPDGWIPLPTPPESSHDQQAKVKYCNDIRDRIKSQIPDLDSIDVTEKAGGSLLVEVSRRGLEKKIEVGGNMTRERTKDVIANVIVQRMRDAFPLVEHI